MPTLTGGEIIAKYLEKEGVEYLVGIPGHGSTNLLDAFNDSEVEVIQPRHEEGATHLADGYARASGDPLAVFTSIGPGATNTVTGVATAYVDSIPMVVFTGAPQTHEYGQGILQEIERQKPGDFPSVMEPVTKKSFVVNDVEQLPRVLRRAFQVATTGRPGPVHVDVPMDVQGGAADVEIPEPAETRTHSRPGGDPESVSEAADLLAEADRPVIVPGGGCMLGEAWDEVQDLAEHLKAPVIPTFQAKGIIPEDHELFVGYAGWIGSTAGNELASNADVVLAIGCRFTDMHTSSFEQGVSFEIPPSKLIHVDIDNEEIGKNYPVEVGILGDSKVVTRQLHEAVADRVDPVGTEDNEYYDEIQRLWAEWQELVEERQTDDVPMSISRALASLREALDRDGIVVSSAGQPQEVTNPQFPVYEPRTNISCGGFSTMGFGVSAAIGAKLARPDRQVVDVEGDGSFMMCNQEVNCAVEHDVDVTWLVVNNDGWKSIRNLQVDKYGWDRVLNTPFEEGVDFVQMAESFGVEFSERVIKPENLTETLEEALAHDGPALVEAIVEPDNEDSGAIVTGKWDLADLERDD
ncbi:thiamine pyrophosphate protein central region (plasmid) [Haloterrigena turkmenica DSM 5511]|uniref:Thiamine pyrophosphate protein central region n=1 Tax=Haloterrigena turkmenica (strain ATCC 51198 / DSM 5511 / JCM 9101 / NCIMB 13204 / VKM B-1734 / 4k) TaxID=543526 RepID=D2S1E9_HALTV|nr:thiamine pyrophosphate-binding protein [Haloterrigena turkmenica]ADB63196.1 thiamine pyrophosphate protein central region [Haloterrigena turkmenica DSM 5511]